MVDEGMALTGRGRIPNVPEPPLSVDAIEGCRMRPTVGADMVLGHGADKPPTFMVCSLELLKELEGPSVPAGSMLSFVGRVSARSPITGTDDSGGDPKGAIALGTLSTRCRSEYCL